MRSDTMYQKQIRSYDLIGTSCVNAHAMRVEYHGVIETHPQIAAVSFLSEMAKNASYVDFFSRPTISLAAYLVVSSWAYL